MENDIKQLEEINEIYFSNIQHIIICFNDNWILSTPSKNSVIKKFKNIFNIYLSRSQTR